jgi:hypothetical protein
MTDHGRFRERDSYLVLIRMHLCDSPARNAHHSQTPLLSSHFLQENVHRQESSRMNVPYDAASFETAFSKEAHILIRLECSIPTSSGIQHFNEHKNASRIIF